jgi:hypothetical protein
MSEKAAIVGLALAFIIGAIVGAEITARSSHLSTNNNVTASLETRISDQSYQITALQRQLQQAKTAVEQAEQAAKAAEAAKPGRFQITKESGRTWRLDTATGDVCLLLASQADWKGPKLARQACALK